MSTAAKSQLFTELPLLSLAEEPASAIAGLRRFKRVATAVEMALDCLTVALVAAGAWFGYDGWILGKQGQYAADRVWLAGFGFSILFVLMLDCDGAYRPGNSLLRVRETERVLRVSLASFGLALPAAWRAEGMISANAYLLALAVLPPLLILQKQGYYGVIRWLHARGRGVHRVAVYGAGFFGRRIFSALARSPKLGLLPVALVDDNPRLLGQNMYELGYQRRGQLRVVAGPLSAAWMERQQADVAVIAIPKIRPEKLAAIIRDLAPAGIQILFAPPYSEQAEYFDLDGLMLAAYNHRLGNGQGRACKRIFDLLAAGACLLLALPLGLLLAAVVRLDSPGPVLFSQQRVGYLGRRFRLYKFRTLRADSPAYANSPDSPADWRITRVGRWLRRTSLDELPQLWNVLRGEMSLVGPRPEMPFIVERYTARQRQRLAAVPGITGLWQLSADRRYRIHENLQDDLYYIRNHNFFMDLAILLHTLVYAMRGI